MSKGETNTATPIYRAVKKKRMNLGRLLQQDETGGMTRRDLLGALAVLVAAPSAVATAHAAPAAPIGVVHQPHLFRHGNFDADAVVKTLAERGVKASIRLRGDTKELYFTDPDGIRVQFQDVKYKGGTGPLGDQ